MNNLPKSVWLFLVEPCSGEEAVPHACVSEAFALQHRANLIDALFEERWNESLEAALHEPKPSQLSQQEKWLRSCGVEVSPIRPVVLVGG